MPGATSLMTGASVMIFGNGGAGCGASGKTLAAAKSNAAITILCAPHCYAERIPAGGKRRAVYAPERSQVEHVDFVGACARHEEPSLGNPWAPRRIARPQRRMHRAKRLCAEHVNVVFGFVRDEDVPILPVEIDSDGKDHALAALRNVRSAFTQVDHRDVPAVSGHRRARVRYNEQPLRLCVEYDAERAWNAGDRSNHAHAFRIYG